ncbi:uncharacterized protein LOC103669498 [Ursus maritimus]|uniref:Uncharacterized protein LOC103669498 n=1 Tax=Ursus maritimus TaxID=29073 RepID=A0A384CML2_URSMA|nr:uncharacterized protein LOC103669498 [Ursus maritimus]
MRGAGRAVLTTTPRWPGSKQTTDAQETPVGAMPAPWAGSLLSSAGSRQQGQDTAVSGAVCVCVCVCEGAPHTLEGSWECLGVSIRTRGLSFGSRPQLALCVNRRPCLEKPMTQREVGFCRVHAGLGAALHSRAAGNSNHRRFFSLEKVIGSGWSVAPLEGPGSRPASLGQWNYQASHLWDRARNRSPCSSRTVYKASPSWDLAVACRHAGRTGTSVPYLRKPRLGGKAPSTMTYGCSLQRWTQPQDSSCSAGPGYLPARGPGGRSLQGSHSRPGMAEELAWQVSPLVGMSFPWPSSLLRGKGTSLGSLEFVDKICFMVCISFGSA